MGFYIELSVTGMYCWQTYKKKSMNYKEKEIRKSEFLILGIIS